MNNYLFIGLSGRPGSGKDTCADVLQLHHPNFYRYSFADPAYQEICNAFNVDARLFTDTAAKDHPVPALAIHRCNNQLFIDEMRKTPLDLHAPRSPRFMLSLWYGDFRCNQNKNYWVELAVVAIDEAMRKGFKKFVITDIYFANEANLIKKMGGKLWLISRAEAEYRAGAQNLPVTLNSHWFDDVIENNGSYTSFANNVLKAYQESL